MMSGPFLEGRWMDNKAINGRSSDLSSLSSTFPHALQNNVLAVAHIRQMKLERVKGGLTAAGLYAIFTRFPFNGLCPTVIDREVTHCEGKDQRFVPSFLFGIGWERWFGELFIGMDKPPISGQTKPDCKRVPGRPNSASSHNGKTNLRHLHNRPAPFVFFPPAVSIYLWVSIEEEALIEGLFLLCFNALLP